MDGPLWRGPQQGAEELQARLTDILPENMSSKLRWLHPFVRNNSVSAEVGWKAKDIADMSSQEPNRYHRRAACDTSPGRREAVKASCAAKDMATDLNPNYSFTVCPFIDVWDSSGLVRLGWWQRSGLGLKLSPLEARTCGAQTPVDVSRPALFQEHKAEGEEKKENAEVNSHDNKDNEDTKRPHGNTEEGIAKPADAKHKRLSSYHSIRQACRRARARPALRAISPNMRRGGIQRIWQHIHMHDKGAWTHESIQEPYRGGTDDSWTQGLEVLGVGHRVAFKAQARWETAFMMHRPMAREIKNWRGEAGATTRWPSTRSRASIGSLAQPTCWPDCSPAPTSPTLSPSSAPH